MKELKIDNPTWSGEELRHAATRTAYSYYGEDMGSMANLVMARHGKDLLNPLGYHSAEWVAMMDRRAAKKKRKEDYLRGKTGPQ